MKIRRDLGVADIALLLIFIFFFSCFLLSARYIYNGFKPKIKGSYTRTPTDDYDSSLMRLNSIDKTIAYCDSVYKAEFPRRTYPGIVSETLRERFYHGYSYYDLHNNSVGAIFEPVVKQGAAAIVIPDDIMKYPNAACSQQSIVGMEIFRKKGYTVRKVSMFDSVQNVGHFAFEVYYENRWHFIDTDQEPDVNVLKKYGRPSVEFLMANPSVVLEAYRNKANPEMFKRLLLSAKIGPVNKFPAPHAYLYQVVTKYVTYCGWIFVLCGLMIVRFIRVGKKRFKSHLSVAIQRNDKASFSTT